MNKYSITLIIPCYNEGKRLDTTVFINFAMGNPDIKLLFVDDGSRDNTKEIIEKLAKDYTNIEALIQKKNRGKAEAVRAGALHSFQTNDSELIGYFDADLATPLEISKDLAAYIINEENCYQLAMGARVKRLGATINRKFKRHFFGRTIATLISLILRLAVYDTQCGAKVFKADLVPKIFDKPFRSKWLFDVEIVARLLLLPENAKRNPIFELPLKRWIHVGDSKIKFKDFFRIPIDLLRIYLEYHSALVKRHKTQIHAKKAS